MAGRKYIKCRQLMNGSSLLPPARCRRRLDAFFHRCLLLLILIWVNDEGCTTPQQTCSNLGRAQTGRFFCFLTGPGKWARAKCARAQIGRPQTGPGRKWAGPKWAGPKWSWTQMGRAQMGRPQMGPGRVHPQAKQSEGACRRLEASRQLPQDRLMQLDCIQSAQKDVVSSF